MKWPVLSGCVNAVGNPYPESIFSFVEGCGVLLCLEVESIPNPDNPSFCIEFQTVYPVFSYEPDISVFVTMQVVVFKLPQHVPSWDVAGSLGGPQRVDVDAFHALFSANPQTFERVFADGFDKITFEGIPCGLLVEADELVAVVPAQSTAIGGYPQEATAVFFHVFHKVVGQALLDTDSHE